MSMIILTILSQVYTWHQAQLPHVSWNHIQTLVPHPGKFALHILPIPELLQWYMMQVTLKHITGTYPNEYILFI